MAREQDPTAPESWAGFFVRNEFANGPELIADIGERQYREIQLRKTQDRTGARTSRPT